MEKLLIALILTLTPALTHAAGSCTYTPTDTSSEWQHAATLVVTWSWTSAAGSADDATCTTPNVGRNESMYILSHCDTNPDGTAIPADNYDITIVNNNGVDIMGDALADRDLTNSERAVPYSGGPYGGVPEASAYDLNVSNTGGADQGTVKCTFIKHQN